MTCRDSELLLQRERDGALAPEPRAQLEEHLAACPACRQRRAELVQAINALRAEVAAVPVPDVDLEWHELHTKLREAEPTPTRRRLAPVIWLGTPLAAAAAVALAFFVSRPSSQLHQTVAVSTTVATPAANTTAVGEPAHAEFVEPGDANASTIVYVDKTSGWLVVWATDTQSETKG